MTTGALTSVGGEARYWSSAPTAASSVSGAFLAFSASNLEPEGSGGRAYARTVRCVQHLRLLFPEENAGTKLPGFVFCVLERKTLPL